MLMRIKQRSLRKNGTEIASAVTWWLSSLEPCSCRTASKGPRFVFLVLPSGGSPCNALPPVQAKKKRPDFVAYIAAFDAYAMAAEIGGVSKT